MGCERCDWKGYVWVTTPDGDVDSDPCDCVMEEYGRRTNQICQRNAEVHA